MGRSGCVGMGRIDCRGNGYGSLFGKWCGQGDAGQSLKSAGEKFAAIKASTDFEGISGHWRKANSLVLI
ncbi:MAG: hypothetical protein M2R45_05208 [Verrucomicrobia subdivision 3 bacterium]|nr:hypothetical protein [Limisphaerales bacterium]MCS1413888.1 hypothetical protein [Limisphaerales bacterium]